MKVAKSQLCHCKAGGRVALWAHKKKRPSRPVIANPEGVKQSRLFVEQGEIATARFAGFAMTGWESAFLTTNAPGPTGVPSRNDIGVDGNMFLLNMEMVSKGNLTCREISQKRGRG